MTWSGTHLCMDIHGNALVEKTFIRKKCDAAF